MENLNLQGNASLRAEAFEIKLTGDPGSLGPGWFLIGYEKVSHRVAPPQIINVPTWNPGTNGSCGYYSTIAIEIPFCEEILMFVVGRRRDEAVKSLQDGWALDKALVEKLKKDVEVLQKEDGRHRLEEIKLLKKLTEQEVLVREAVRREVEAERVATSHEKLASRAGKMVELLRKEVGEKRFKEILDED